MQLNDLQVGSGPAQMALEKQFKSDLDYYRKMFSRFVDLATEDKDLRIQAKEYAVKTFADQPDAISTLASIDALQNKLGRVVKNALIFAISVTCTHYIKGTMFSSGIAKNARNAAGERLFMPTKKWEAYTHEMKKEHSFAANIVGSMQLGITSRRKYKDKILAVMDYLIEQGAMYMSSRREQFIKNNS